MSTLRRSNGASASPRCIVAFDIWSGLGDLGPALLADRGHTAADRNVVELGEGGGEVPQPALTLVLGRLRFRRSGFGFGLGRLGFGGFGFGGFGFGRAGRLVGFGLLASQP